MSSLPRVFHSDRCVNPFNLSGHKGKDLRKISRSIAKKFPDLPQWSIICASCRKLENRNNSTSSGELHQMVVEKGNIEDEKEEKEEEEEEEKYAEEENEVEEEGEDEEEKIEVTPEDLIQLLDGIRHKFNSLPNNDPLRLSILTIAPDSWSIRKVQKVFCTSYRMARQAKMLKASQGILASPIKSSGKRLPEATVEKVVHFYENDVNSRILPNAKDAVTVKINGEKRKEQKRLLLDDIKNLHVLFKEQFPEHPIGLSKFAELKPKWCVRAGSAGTHIVCVCTIHQNFKAMIDAVNLQKLSNNTFKDHKDCMNYVLCRNPKIQCYLNECKACPKISKFSNFIEKIFDNNNIDQVIFSTWQSTDRCTLIKQCLSSEDFISTLCSKLKDLIPHHFISKEQSKYISEMKNKISDKEVLVHLDFSENYAFVAQDAAQAFHFNNDQSTIFPAVVYYKSDHEVKHFSTVTMSQCTTHDATAVHIMLQKLVPEIRKVCPKSKKIIYVSDGAKQHFKNRFNMCNLMNHKKDFGVEAEWHCFAPAHGKGSPDGIGATVKREATRASLQLPAKDAILNVQALYSWANKRNFGINFFLYTKEDYDRVHKSLAGRFRNCPHVTKIQKGYAFIPHSNGFLTVKRYSNALKSMSEVYYKLDDADSPSFKRLRTRNQN